jgi:hypothetical protein
MGMKRKTFEQGSLKLLQKPGEFECVFATLGVVDKEGDVITQGAIGEQDVRISAWGHDWGKLPVGRGRTLERGDKAVCEGEFFLDTEGGAETYRVVKGLADLQEWSFGYDVQDSEPRSEGGRTLRKLSIFEVSPVLLGAGVGTRTTAIKTAEGPGDPLDVLMDIELMDLRLRDQERKGLETPADVDGAILELMDAGDVKAMLDDQLWDADIEDLEAKLDEPTAPTNLDRLRAAARTTFPDASEPYIETQVAMALQRLVWDVREQDPVATPHEARARVQWWAQQPT